MSVILRSILLVDDDETLLRTATRDQRNRRVIRTASTSAAARQLASARAFDLAIVDYVLRTATTIESGIDLIAELKALQPEMRVVLITACGSMEVACRALDAGAMWSFAKPLTIDEICARVDGTTLDRDARTTTLADVEREHIARVLADCRGDVGDAARVLGIHRTSLQRRLRARQRP